MIVVFLQVEMRHLHAKKFVIPHVGHAYCDEKALYKIRYETYCVGWNCFRKLEFILVTMVLVYITT